MTVVQHLQKQECLQQVIHVERKFLFLKQFIQNHVMLF